MNWIEHKVPPFCERLIGFSVPQNDQVLVVSYEGMHFIQLGARITVESDEGFAEYDLYDPRSGICCYRDLEWTIIGLDPGRPLLSGQDGEQLRLDTKAETLSVIKDGCEQWKYRYENFSGDWAAATFSPDGRFIVLGCPYDFDFRVFGKG